jgi:hypothetical protein
MSAESAARLAIANERMNKGVKTLNENVSSWATTLRTADKRSADYAATLTEVNKAFADLVGAIDEASIPLDFFDTSTVDGAKHLAQLERAAEGDTDAINELGVALASTTIAGRKISNLWDNVEGGAEATKEALASLDIDGVNSLDDLETKLQEAQGVMSDFMTGYANAVAQGTSAA